MQQIKVAVFLEIFSKCPAFPGCFSYEGNGEKKQNRIENIKKFKRDNIWF